MRSIVLIFVLSTALISSCITSHYDRSPIQKKKGYMVVLETHKSGKGTAYNHPVQLDVQMMKEMMAGFEYVRKVGMLNQKDAGPVFQQIEIDRMAESLVSALAKSGSSQHVRFVSLNKKKAFIVMTTYQKTEGIIFRDSDHRINFVFSDINTQISPDDPTTLEAQFSEKDPMMVTKSDAVLSYQSAMFERYISSTGKAFPMWMAAAVEKPVNKEGMLKAEEAPVQHQSEAKQAPQIDTPEAGENMSVQKEIKEKLIYLKGLMDEGLITEADYNSRKKMLLDKLK